MQPFTINVPDSVLADLKQRLAATRWPDEIEGGGWTYGTNMAYLKELVEYWRTRYDWRLHERHLNAMPQYTAEVDGLTIHFAYQKGKGPKPFPLIVTHGWPGSFFEFIKVFGPLTDPGAHGGDPADAFDLVVPSLPGYGFSGKPSKPGMNATRTADLWAKLMTEVLGYQRFGAQGGDWGALVTTALGYRHPRHVAGIHLNMVLSRVVSGVPDLSEKEKQWLAEVEAWRKDESAYSQIQGTKPQTLAYSLNDSPAGLCAWIVEKFRTWSDCGGDVERRFSKDVLLTNIMLYWVTGAINSSFWPYYARRHGPWPIPDGARIEVPTAYASFPREILHPPRAWAERVFNIRRWTVMPSGGHFAALEEPAALAADVRAFFRDLRP